jgi:prepilin-type processing-associated H-X9-DG protein
MTGIERADDVSYICMGSADLQREERQGAAELRVAADNEEEDDEMCEDGWRHMWGQFLPGLVPDQGDWNSYMYGGGGGDVSSSGTYHYVGGLERQDNHQQDGVNVLYFDWHASFDGRSWPSPIGMPEAESGGWQKYTWDASQSYTDNCKAGHIPNNVVAQ